jgi:hypothetical protein
MKGKKYSIEDKIRILRQADAGRSTLEVCREANISEVTFHHRPHSKLGYQSRKCFAATTQSAPSPAPVSPSSLRRRWTNQGKQHNQN